MVLRGGANAPQDPAASLPLALLNYGQPSSQWSAWSIGSGGEADDVGTACQTAGHPPDHRSMKAIRSELLPAMRSLTRREGPRPPLQVPLRSLGQEERAARGLPSMTRAPTHHDLVPREAVDNQSDATGEAR